MTEWYATHEGIWGKVWQILSRGVADAKHPARRPTFATVSPSGWPEARTVVLRGADPDACAVTVHTDLYSDKVKSLDATPRAALHIWDARLALQIRLQAEVTVQSGSVTQALWDKIPDHARQSYGVTPPPGTLIENALDYDKTPDPRSFAVLQCRVALVDAVHLGTDHRRARFTQARDWVGEWLSP